MKLFTMMILAILTTQAHAGSWSYSCESTDGKLKLTRDNLVLITKDDNGSIRDLITKNYNSTVNTGPNAEESLVYKDSYEGQSEGDVTVTLTKLISDKEIESEDGDCPAGDSGGHAGGFSTNKKILKATVKYYDQTSNVTLKCYETFAWSGTCHFDGEEEK